MVADKKNQTLSTDSVWLNKSEYDEAETIYYEKLASQPSGDKKCTSLVQEIAVARKKIQNSLKEPVSFKGDGEENGAKISQLCSEISSLKKAMASVQSQLESALSRIHALEQKPSSTPAAPTSQPTESKKVEEDEDDIDLFGSDEEDDGKAAKLREERLQAYAEKKSKKTAVIAKSSVVLDVKPWDDETDMKAMETEVRKIQQDGLVWGASKLVPLAYGIKKLQIVAVVEDEKVSIDALQETITELQDLVQSVDVAAFNKL